ncbi:MAG: GGDEF domain-containing protein [Psychrobium sp.]
MTANKTSMLEQLLTQLQQLIKQSPLVDEEMLQLIFKNNSNGSKQVDSEQLKTQLLEFIKTKGSEQSRLKETINEFSQILSSTPSPEIKDADSLHRIVANLEGFTDFYAQASTQLANELKDERTQQIEVIATHKENLTHLYETIDIQYQLHSALNELAAALTSIETTEQLLGNVEEVIALLLKSTLSEKEQSKFFVKDIQQEIDDLKTINRQTDDINRSGQKQHQQWDKAASRNLNNLNQLSDRLALNKSDTKAMNNEVTLLKESLAEKTVIDEKLFALQQKQIEKLTNKLEQTEQEASTYHSQLIEQRLINMQDSLTKLPNRKSLEQKFEANFITAKQSNQSLWVAVADIDHFKSINDNYGHSAGDKTLQVIASALSNSIRDSEFIARYGGEEFVLLIPDLPQNAITNVLNRVRERIKSIPFKFKDKKVQITMSIGATKIKATDTDRQVSFDRADKALYQAKRQGRDRVIIY